MDFAPRRIIALVREGFREDALSCQTIWLCASCYACAVHCPRQIHITDVMYSLKKGGDAGEALSAAFPDSRTGGRNSIRWSAGKGAAPSFWLVLRMAFRTNPLQLLTMAGTGWQLMRTGRLRLRQDRIKEVHELQSELAGREVR